MIIELTGIPGSGKSTVLKELENSLKDDRYVFDIQKYILGFDASVAIFDLYLISNFFRLSLSDWLFLKKIIKIICKSQNSFFHKINILRNSYKKIVLHKIIKNKNKIFFIDEGLHHIPFTLFVDIGRQLNNNDVRELIYQIPDIDLLIIIDAPDNILFNRVINRGQEGHRRIDFNSKKNIQIFMNQSRDVLNLIENNIEYKIYQNIEEIIDGEEIIKTIGLKDV